MDSLQTLVVLMTAAVILVALAQRLQIPYPILLVLGGAALEFIPGLSEISINPNLIQFIVLPPILYYSAFWISNREFKKNWREIFSLALGLVVATTVGIAFIFKWLFPGLPWALAFTFGAIISPPDAIVAGAILNRFKISNRLKTILEGESLVNDATGIVLYKLAIAALLSGTFSYTEGGIEFIKVAAGGGALGVFISYLIQTLSSKYLDAITESFSLS